MYPWLRARLGPGGGDLPLPPLPPFDTTDQYGNQVHTTIPPEQSVDRTKARMLADFTGVTIPGEWDIHDPDPKEQERKIRENGGVTLTTGPYKGLFIPWRTGQNTSPPTMLMTPMLALYPADVQAVFFAEYVRRRRYRHIIIAEEGWNLAENGFAFTAESFKAWCRTLRAQGLGVVWWRGDWRHGVDAFFRDIIDSGLLDWYGHGKEVDTASTSAEYEASLDAVDNYIAGRIPIGVHFTAPNTPETPERNLCYPIGMPRADYLKNWARWNGRVHLWAQFNVDAPAGLQAVGLWYARLRVNCGQGDGAEGPGAPDSIIVLFETMSTAQLEGRCTEEYGNLRNFELFCATRDQVCARPAEGVGGGIRYPGTPGRPF